MACLNSVAAVVAVAVAVVLLQLLPTSSKQQSSDSNIAGYDCLDCFFGRFSHCAKYGGQKQPYAGCRSPISGGLNFVYSSITSLLLLLRLLLLLLLLLFSACLLAP